MKYLIDVPDEIELQPLVEQLFEGHGYVKCKVEPYTMRTPEEIEEAMKIEYSLANKFLEKVPNIAAIHKGRGDKLEWVLNKP